MSSSCAMKRWSVPLVLLLTLALGGGLLWWLRTPGAGPPPSTAWLEDVTAARGLDFVHDPGPTGTYFMPQIMGAGGAFFDCDGDGLLDIYLLQSGGEGNSSRNALFRQRADGTFEDISAGSGLDVSGFSIGVAIGDVNN